MTSDLTDFAILELALIVGVMFVAAFVQSSVGFGLVLIAGPILLLLDSGFLPGPMLATALILTTLVAFRERRAIHFEGVLFAMLGRVPGTVLAIAILAKITAAMFDVIFAVFVLLGVALSVGGWRIAPTRASSVVAGAASGFMGTISAIGGPPLALLYQHSTGPRMRGTLAAMFVLGAVLSLAGLAWIDRFGPPEIGRAAILLPGAVGGFLASRWGAAWIDRKGMRPAVLGLSTISALAVLARTLYG